MAAAAGLLNVDIAQGDASMTSAYAGVVPAHVLLVCGVFGNISDTDIHRTVSELPRLSAAGHGGLDSPPPATGRDTRHPGVVRRGRVRRDRL